jgi:Ca2+-binding RTX toxin-like protein
MATINGTNSGDSLYGTAAADIINGLNGNDTLKGFGDTFIQLNTNADLTVDGIIQLNGVQSGDAVMMFL